MAQQFFDCSDIRKQIFEYCLPQYPLITKKMIDRRIQKYMTYFEYYLSKIGEYNIIFDYYIKETGK